MSPERAQPDDGTPDEATDGGAWKAIVPASVYSRSYTFASFRQAACFLKEIGGAEGRAVPPVEYVIVGGEVVVELFFVGKKPPPMVVRYANLLDATAEQIIADGEGLDS